MIHRSKHLSVGPVPFVARLLLLGSTTLGAGCTAPAAFSTNDAEEAAVAQDAAAAADHGTDAGRPKPSVDAAAKTDAGQTYPAPHAAAPQVVFSGGRVLASPRIIPITYDGDPWRANIEAFVAAIGSTPYWSSVTREYGVGPATSGTPIHLQGPAPTTISDARVQTWLASMLDGTHPEWPLPDGNTMYAIYYPSGTAYTLAGYGGVCVDGNDWVTELPDGAKVPYIVMPRCPTWPGLSAWDSFTWTQSHEFLEEATDPYKTAYYTDDADHVAWSWNPPLAEIGDMCDYAWALTDAPGVTGLVQRAWSNSAAAAGKNPCVPAGAGAYFNAAPVLTDDVPWSNGGPHGTTKGVRIAVGQTRTVEVDLFSDGPTAPWTVTAYDFDAEEFDEMPDLQLSLDRTTGSNGDTFNLTIHVLKAGAVGGSRFVLASTLDDQTNFWIGYVGN